MTSLAPVFVALDPPAGTAVTHGSIVTLTPCPAPLGSPAVATPQRHFVVPDFTNMRLSAAVTWTDKHSLYWATTLPATVIPDADGLLDGYEIVRQSPQPGQELGQGVLKGRAYRVTPLTLRVVPI
ncbi:MAG TPA: hypothetical protein VHC43_09340 [Mycobacteriales bacterium]|nr:hypothetical protein [Mycobacteriales bacterium]